MATRKDDPGLRRLRARIGGLALAASRDMREHTAPARRAFLSRFEREVAEAAARKGERLSPAEFARRVELVRRRYFTELALRRRRRRARGRRSPPR